MRAAEIAILAVGVPVMIVWAVIEVDARRQRRRRARRIGGYVRIPAGGGRPSGGAPYRDVGRPVRVLPGAPPGPREPARPDPLDEWSAPARASGLRLVGRDADEPGRRDGAA